MTTGGPGDRSAFGRHELGQSPRASSRNPPANLQISHHDRVTAIWMEQANGVWSLQQAARYDNEQALHDIVMNTPELLPLSGAPRLTVIGREVALPTSGYADVIAVEPDGRPVIIEVKLKNNAESRRAVIAQTLS